MTAPWDDALRRARELDTCDPPSSGRVATREWRLPCPWPPVRMPDDLDDIQGPSSEDAPRRAFQNPEGDTLQLFFLPPGLPVATAALDSGRQPPGAKPEGRCARVIGDCVLFITRSKIEIFDEVGWMAMVVVAARTGECLIATVSASDAARRERLVAAVYDLAERGPVILPAPAPGATARLAVRFHDRYETLSPVWQIEERPRRDPSFAEQEGRDALARFSFEHVRNHWHMPKEVDPEHVRIHEEEVREYANDLVLFHLGRVEQLDRSARSRMLTFVVENTGDVPATDVRVKLTFPPHVLVGSFGTVVKPCLELPEPPQMFEPGPGFLKRRRKPMVRTLVLGDLAQAAREDKWDGYQAQPDGSLTVAYRVARVNPRAAPNLTTTWVMFRRWEDVAPLAIGWEVTAPGAPTTSGTLSMGVRAATEAG